MEDATYFIKGRLHSSGDPALQQALARVYDSSERPRCMCVPGGVEMYVARHDDYLIKRMPGTGGMHHVTCHSFEPEPDSSGLGALIGEAIVEHAPGEFELRTSFALAHGVGKTAIRREAADEPAAVHTTAARMSLRAVLHFLYDRAGFNRWYPAMEGRRSQAVILKFLTLAAQGVILKGRPLEERLYIPEPFRVADAQAIGERRRQKLALLLSPQAGEPLKLAILIGQLVDAQTAATGRRLTIKHLPDVPLHIDHKTWLRAERAYGSVLQAADADVERKPRVVIAALIHARREHLYQVESLSLMLATDQWIPLEGLHELALIETLQRQQRSFIKPLRFDAKAAAGFPIVLLLDAGNQPVPLHVIGAFMSAKDLALKQKVLRDLGEGAWVWHTDRKMPALPVKVTAAAQGATHVTAGKAATEGQPAVASDAPAL
jgi:hypothetical protein